VVSDGSLILMGREILLMSCLTGWALVLIVGSREGAEHLLG
jgi:hypothetical protein